nr:MAG TPA: hypothetical protein [Bacteriophage sp.]
MGGRGGTGAGGRKSRCRRRDCKLQRNYPYGAKN